MASTRTRKPRAAAAEAAPKTEAAAGRDIAVPATTFRFEAWPTEFRVVTQWVGARPEFYAKYGLPGHEGVDFVAPLGSKIFAVAPGTIKRVQATDDGNAYGIHVRIQHADGYETIYGHFKSAIVKLGDQVAAGQQIGYADSTGNSQGSHLHLTLKHASETLGRFPNHIVDPTPFVKALLEQGKDGAAYVKDIIPDGTQFQAGQAFEQRWTVRNTGTTAWGEGYTLAYLSGDRIGGPASVPVPETSPGGLADVTVNFQAPAAPGKHRSVWQMLAPAKPGGVVPPTRFGERMWVDIVVPAVAAPAQPKELFEEAAEQAAAPTPALIIDTLADVIGSFEDMSADEIEALLGNLPLLAGVEVILRGHAAQLGALSGEQLDALTQRTLDQIVSLSERLRARG
ncbi:MAG: peptidoglycan DD-metalloendopeptidase family protein [Nitrososphaerales archaeon]